MPRGAQVAAHASVPAGSSSARTASSDVAPTQADRAAAPPGGAEAAEVAEAAGATIGGESADSDSDSTEDSTDAELSDLDDLLVPIGRAKRALQAAVGAWGAQTRDVTEGAAKASRSVSKRARS
jgi:hypothetical protein